MKLTAKQQAFCLNILHGMSQHEAYTAAGYSQRQSASTIDRHACALAQNDKVMARIEELRKKTEDESVANVLERKQVLTEIVRGRFADFMSNLTPDKLKSAALQEVKIAETQEGAKTTTIKLHNPVQAIAELNKMGGDYPPADVLKLETGDVLGAQLTELLAVLRGYGNKD